MPRLRGRRRSWVDEGRRSHVTSDAWSMIALCSRGRSTRARSPDAIAGGLVGASAACGRGRPVTSATLARRAVGAGDRRARRGLSDARTCEAGAASPHGSARRRANRPARGHRRRSPTRPAQLARAARRSARSTSRPARPRASARRVPDEADPASPARLGAPRAYEAGPASPAPRGSGLPIAATAMRIATQVDRRERDVHPDDLGRQLELVLHASDDALRGEQQRRPTSAAGPARSSRRGGAPAPTARPPAGRAALPGARAAR